MPRLRSATDRRAREAARLLTSLRPLDGVPWVDRGRYALIDFAGFSSIRPAALTAALLEPQLPVMSGPLRGSLVEVSEDTLTDWAKALADLAATRNLPKLIKSGTRPLRRWRGRDIGGEVARLSARLRAVSDAARFAHRADSADLLGLRVHALGGWAVDPLDYLTADDLRRAAASPDPLVAAVAGVLAGSAEDPVHPVFAARLRLAGADVPPQLAAAPPAEVRTITRLGERLSVLFGLTFARRVVNDLADQFTGVPPPCETLRAFARAAGSIGRDGVTFPPHSEERTALQMLGTPPEDHADWPEWLVEGFWKWVRPPKDGNDRPRLLAAAREASGRGPGAMAVAMVHAWADLRKPAPPDAAMLAARVRFALRVPDWAGDLPAATRPGSLDRFSTVWTRLSSARRAWVLRAAKTIGPPADPADLVEIAEEGLPENLAWRIARRGEYCLAYAFRHHPARLARYLDLRDALARRPVPGLDPDCGWLREMFRTGQAWAGTAALVVLRRARAHAPAEAAGAFDQLSRAMGRHGPLAEYHQALAAALAAWDTPTVAARPPEAAALARALDLTPAEIDRYLHLRRLAGYGETFAAGLTEVLTVAAREAEEADALRRLLSESRTDDARLTDRLARLLDPDRAFGRRAAARVRGRTRFTRSLTVLEQESLRAVTDDVCRQFLARRLGNPLPPGPLPAGVWEALALLQTHNISLPLLTEFLDDVLGRRPLADRPANAGWLARAAAHGVDVAAWRAGFRATATVGGEPVAFATEADPLHVLKMGSYFATCLSLDDGSNAASTLVNALDVNKHVIYGRRADGAVVCRKLIGATARGELAGYTTFVAAHPGEMEPALLPHVLRFAARCRLRPSDTARPEVLHPGFWYDDGNEKWPTTGAE